jgi:polyvinyl alcohol dehydrogenase (cytochrome)
MHKCLHPSSVALAIWALVVTVAPMHATDQALTVDGKSLFRERCAACHEGGNPRAPDLATLRKMSVNDIRSALTNGRMKEQAAGLTSPQVAALSEFLAADKAATTTAPGPELRCEKTVDSQVDLAAGPHWNGWGVDVSQRRFQPEAEAQLTADQVPRLKLKWAFGFAGANRAYAQPTVAGGRLFVGSATGKVYSLDAKSGCTHWTFVADAPVRTAVSIGKTASGWVAYFGDQRANAYAVDALSGKLLWKTHIDEHPAAIITGAPTLAGGVLYVPVTSYEEVTGSSLTYVCCSFRGSIAALDAETGRISWKSYTIAKAPEPMGTNQRGVQRLAPSGAGIWSAPTIDLQKRMVYVTTGDSYSDPAAETSDAFVAFHLDDGKPAWWHQMTSGDAYTSGCAAPALYNCPDSHGPDFDFGSSPVLVDLGNGRHALVAGQKSGMVSAINPDREGAILWQVRVSQGGALGGVEWGAAADERNLYVAVSDARPQLVVASTPGVQPSIYGPPLKLDPDVGGGLYALKLETGEVVWHTPHPGCNDQPGCSPAQSAAVTAIPGVVFSGGLDGHLRAYSTITGSILWDVDTKGEYHAVNGIVANGGSIDGPGAVIVGGMLYVNSGYQYLGSTPGNVLLAFSASGD